MPEEINRILTDRISTLLLCPTQTAVDNLHREGFPYPAPGKVQQRIENVGDVMYDAVLYYRDLARERISLDTWGLTDKGYALCTLHRQENTDDPERLGNILAALREIARELPVVFPIHPRTRNRITQDMALGLLDGLTVIEPLPYLEMQRLQMSANVILTDSGGMQKEAFFHGIPCITLRDETEWVETVDAGWNHVTGTNRDAILKTWINLKIPSETVVPLYGNGDSATLIIVILINSRFEK